MSDKIKDGGPAFPRQAYLGGIDGAGDGPIIYEDTGMSLRDWFAGVALQGIVSTSKNFDAGNNHAVYCAHAYRFSDAMLVEREKSK